MTAVSRDAPRAAAQRPGGQAHGGRWTLPRRSAGPQQPACSRCAGGGKPRALPRGIGGRSFCNQVAIVGGELVALGVDDGVAVLALLVALSGGGSGGLMRGVALAAVVAGEDDGVLAAGGEDDVAVEHVASDVVNAAGVGHFLRDGEGGHFALLGFRRPCATDDLIIVHHAPIVKSFLQQNSEGGSKPSNV